MGNLFSSTAPKKKVILVTGASSGIGKATALHLLERGHVVYGAARRVDKMQDLVQAGGHAIAMDVTKEAQVVSAVKRIVSEQDGKLDVLVNNAGYAVYGAVESTSIEDARRQFDVNLFGVARLIQEVVPHMRKQKSGTIINLSSMGGKIYTPFGAWYHATKHAIEGFSDCLRIELHQFNIKVAIIEPGLIKTEFGDVMFQPMMDRSKGTPYEECVNAMAKNFGESGGSDPIVIARAIAHASESSNPKRRYVAGARAGALLFLRGWLGDGVFDALMLSTMKS